MVEAEKDRGAAAAAGLSELQVILTADAVLAGVNVILPAGLAPAASLDDLRDMFEDLLEHYRLIVGGREPVRVLGPALVALRVVNALLPPASPRIESIEALRGTLADANVVEAFARGSLSVVQLLDGARKVVTSEQWRSIASESARFTSGIRRARRRGSSVDLWEQMVERVSRRAAGVRQAELVKPPRMQH